MMARGSKRPILIWSDKSYSQYHVDEGLVHDAGLGVVIYVPVTGEPIVAAAQTPAYFFAIFVPKRQYVGQLEALAALAAYTTAVARRPGMFIGREVVHFVDNTNVVAGLRKGYSSRPLTPFSCLYLSGYLLLY